MNEPNKRDEEVPTGHGATASVTVVDCCSCEQTVPFESTAFIAVVDERKTNYEGSLYIDKADTGRLCEQCRPDPITFPESVKYNRTELALVVLGMTLGMVVSVTLMVGSF